MRRILRVFYPARPNDRAPKPILRCFVCDAPIISGRWSCCPVCRDRGDVLNSRMFGRTCGGPNR